MVVGKIEERGPILPGHRVLAGTDIITKRAVNQFIWRGHLGGRQSPGAEKAIDRVRRLEHVELAGRIGPGIFGGIGQEHRARGGQGDPMS